MIRYSNIRFEDGAMEKLRRQAIGTPQNRAAAARILNRESEKLRDIAKGLADHELHRRTADRRNSAIPGYHESFSIVTAREIGPGKMRAAARNTHESAHWVENGTQPHVIHGDPLLAFPYNGPKGRGSAGALGQFAVAAGSAPLFVGSSVEHPGAGAHHIMRRARDRYRAQAKRILNG